ncbi:MAG: YitT family protein [Ruminococcaceae bacterium]|nr:YitT family protein [Oscillospiraceae bacterium]
MKYTLRSFSPYAQIVFSAILLAFGYQLFIVENGFAPAGLNGIATMVQYKTGFSIGYMSLLINIPLCTLAYFLVERTFAVRSLCFCLTYSFTFLYLQKLGLDAFQYVTEGHDTIYPVILSGVVGGFVYGICFKQGASTGGTDIVAKYISKHRQELNFFWVTFSLNAVVAAASFFVYAKPGAAGQLVFDYKPVCLCVLYCFISSYIGSYIIKGTKTACEFTIITTHPEEIAAEISQTLRHTCTKVTGEGGFSHGEKTVLLCVVNNHQIVEFQNILKKYDDTFSFSQTVSETYGNFKKIK